ncbi:MAG TPA: flavodoxin family protein [Dissulfurispiraceae bacterium]|nr:flavodoxin family protein [Dissulfurispiraceae bacterium]
MKVIGINGSPRKKWNTAVLVGKALEGAASQGAETELVQLYDLDYKGCISCFACKTIGGKSYGRCAVQDDLTPIFRKIESADGIILGSPIYLGDVSGEMRSFMERLIFPYITYTNPPQSLFPKRIKTGFIYTMNSNEEQMRERGYPPLFASNETYLKMIFGDSQYVCAFDTLQFDDYSKVLSTRFDPVKKATRRKEVFPIDCDKAFQLGINIVRG